MKAILIKQKFIDYCGIVMAEMPQLEVVEIEPKLDTYYKMLDCDTVEMPSRKIGGKYFIFICDEEALCGKVFTVTVRSKSDDELNLVNSVIICNTDDEGNEVSLSDEDIALIKSRFDGTTLNLD